ncbi:hypothetical protein NG831_21340 [Xanthomonas sacchari]|uniref:hypothetical protein n=1 Tax=Xanthomonas TaxID=338 RepID=UPI001D046DD4|nr:MULTISPECIES: hypothetical protein [Xanthomonas]MCW0410580.1 hypothetical protein [Xanthomonas sacchari]UYK66604.1 hypothetical protein NG831_21340 [Xanthomonas sacchari]
MIFDPVKLRVNGFGPGMLKFYLKTDVEEGAPIGNIAVGKISIVVNAWLVGLHQEVGPIIHSANQWINSAIESKEEKRFGRDPNMHRTTLHWGRAIGEWLEKSNNNTRLWDVARVSEEARWYYKERPWSVKEVLQHGLDDYMAFACQCGEFQAAIEMYERWKEMHAPMLLSKVIKPADFAYALCLHKTGMQKFSDEDLFKAGLKILRTHLQEKWLGGGQFIRAATWLKIVYWDKDQSLSPLSTVLKAYENMPKVKKPEFVKLEE